MTGGKFEKLGSVLKGVGAAMGAAFAAIGTAAVSAGKALVDMSVNAAAYADDMGAGIGVGFQDAMKGVEDDMQKSIPTDFDLDMNTAVTGTDGIAGSSQTLDVTIPLTMDGTTLTKIILQLQWSRNAVTVRNLGVV